MTDWTQPDPDAACLICEQPIPATDERGRPRRFCSRECCYAYQPQRRVILAEDVEFLLDTGESAQSIANRVGRSAGGIARALYRARRSDLAAPFEKLSTQARRHPCHDCGTPGVYPGAKRCGRCAAIVREAAKATWARAS